MRCGDRAAILRYYNQEPGSRWDPEREAVERHLDQCPACSRAAALLQPAAADIRQAVATAPEARADCPHAELLSDYVNRRLPQLSRGSVREHLLSCAACLRRVHSLSTQPGTVEKTPRLLRPRLDRRIWVPVALALPGYVVALLALSGRLPGLVNHDPEPTPVLAYQGVAPGQPALPPPTPRPSQAPASAVPPNREANRPAARPRPAPAEANPSGAASHQLASTNVSRRGTRTRAAAPGPGEREPGTPVAGRQPVEEPRDPLLDLALALSPSESQPELVYARELMLKDRVDDVPVALEELTAGSSPRSLALVACVALLYHANPGYDQQAVAALDAALKPEGIEAEPKERALKSLQLASQLAQGRAREVMRRFQEYEKRGVEPAFETYVLAAIVLDQAGQRRDAISALRAAREWLEEDLRSRSAV